MNDFSSAGSIDEEEVLRNFDDMFKKWREENKQSLSSSEE